MGVSSCWYWCILVCPLLSGTSAMPARAQEAIIEITAYRPKPNRIPGVFLVTEARQAKPLPLRGGVYAFVPRGGTVRLVGVTAYIWQVNRSQEGHPVDARVHPADLRVRPIRQPQTPAPLPAAAYESMVSEYSSLEPLPILAVSLERKGDRGMELLYPAGETALTGRPEIEWAPAPLANAYEVILRDAQGQALWRRRVTDPEIHSLTWPADAQPLRPGHYQIHLRALKAFGEAQAEAVMKSQTYRFRVAGPLEVAEIKRELSAARQQSKKVPASAYISLCLRYGQLREVEALTDTLASSERAASVWYQRLQVRRTAALVRE